MDRTLVDAGAWIATSFMPVHGQYPCPCRCMDSTLVHAGAWIVLSFMPVQGYCPRPCRCIDSTLVHECVDSTPRCLCLLSSPLFRDVPLPLVSSFPFVLFRPASHVFCFGSAPSRRVCVVFRSVLSRRVCAMLCFRAVPSRPSLLKKKREKRFGWRFDVYDNDGHATTTVVRVTFRLANLKSDVRQTRSPSFKPRFINRCTTSPPRTNPPWEWDKRFSQA